MTGVVIAVIVVLAIGIGLLLWRSSAGTFPSDEPLRDPHADVAEPLIRPARRHYDTPAAADVDQLSGRDRD